MKFSGGTGFHIGVAFDKPEFVSGKPVKEMFPEAPRVIGMYVQYLIKEPLQDELMGLGFTGDPFKHVNIDPVAIAPRHLIRAPYSINEKKWLASIPIDKNEIGDFSTDDALPEKVDFSRGFLDKKADATELFRQAFDWREKEEKKVAPKKAATKKADDKSVDKKEEKKEDDK